MPGFGFSKAGSALNSKGNFEFKALDDSTIYLKLKSFDGSLTQELDSFYSIIHDQLISKPYLVVDIRDNGGGSESSYFKLLPYVYTNPLKIDSAQIWVSPDNIKRYEESTKPDEELIKRMKNAPSYSFIPYKEDAATTWELDSSTTYPSKVALIYNRGSASAAEGMIMYFMQSSKVITIGENSGGYIGYGNVMDAQTPCGTYVIKNTTTKYAQKSKYEFVGIQPQFIPGKNEDWIKFAQQKLQTQQ
jgi:C-terminal processing protease CtpA/Prc